MILGPTAVCLLVSQPFWSRLKSLTTGWTQVTGDSLSSAENEAESSGLSEIL